MNVEKCQSTHLHPLLYLSIQKCSLHQGNSCTLTIGKNNCLLESHLARQLQRNWVDQFGTACAHTMKLPSHPKSDLPHVLIKCMSLFCTQMCICLEAATFSEYRSAGIVLGRKFCSTWARRIRSTNSDHSQCCTAPHFGKCSNQLTGNRQRLCKRNTLNEVTKLIGHQANCNKSI